MFPNPEWKLKPDMYANVVLTAELGDGLVIPEDAVIDTGVRKVAFRALPGGHFQPVEIETGFKVGEWLQVLSASKRARRSSPGRRSWSTPRASWARPCGDGRYACSTEDAEHQGA